MTDMVRGHKPIEKSKAPHRRYEERERRDFHLKFTTLRFKPVAEFGAWEGRRSLLPPGLFDE